MSRCACASSAIQLDNEDGTTKHETEVPECVAQALGAAESLFAFTRRAHTAMAGALKEIGRGCPDPAGHARTTLELLYAKERRT